MNVPDLLRAGGWRLGHHEGGAPYWEHAERYGLARWEVAAALGDELALVSRERDELRTQFERAVELLQEAGPALKEGAALLRGAAQRGAMAQSEPHWLIKDFNVLYLAARRVIDTYGAPPDSRLSDLAAQLKRLQPAFTETEAARAELAGRGGK